jgi:hypothetical protein
MDWIAQHGGEVMVHLTLPAEFLEWLSTRTRDPAVTQLDPYRDAVLDAGLQSHWLRVMREVGEQSIAERRRHHEEHSHLPRAPDARTAILGQLLAQDGARDPHHRTLGDLCALLEIALESGASIRVVGD